VAEVVSQGVWAMIERISLKICWYLLALATGLGPELHAQVTLGTKESTAPGSWKWVPQSTDFYWGVHHLDQQLQAAQSSELAVRIAETSLWKKTSELFFKEWKDRKSDLAPWKARIDNPAARQIRAFLYDIASQDLFLYADENLARTLEQWNAILPSVERLSNRDTSPEDKADIVSRWVDQWVPEVQLPTIMLAGRFSNLDGALARVDEIEGAIRLGVTFVPDIGGFFKNLRRVDDARGNRLEWRISSDMIPWDQIPETDVLDRETIQDLRRACKDKTLDFSIGTLDEYFCVVISGDKAWKSKFGGQTQLEQHPELQPLISQYVPPGAALMTSTYHTSDRVVAAFQEFLLDGFFRKIARLVLLPILDQQPPASDTADWLTSVLDDASWLDSQIGKHVVRYRGASRMAWMSDQGIESVQIDRTQTRLLDSTQRLEGIQRVGPDPLIVLNVRMASHPEYFATAREIVRRLKGSFEDFMRIGDSRVDLGPLRPIQEKVQAAWPMVVSMTEDWQRRILPNLSGEHLVLLQAGGLRSRNWLTNLGESSALLPMPEASLASRIADPEELSIGSMSIAKSFADLLGNYGIYLPEASALSLSDGWKLATLGQSFGQPQVGTMQGLYATGERWNWLGYSKGQWEAFARADKTPRIDGSTLLGFQEAQDPLATAALIDAGGLARLQNAWLGFLLEKSELDNEGCLRVPPTATGRRLAILPSELMEFLACFESLGRLTSFSRTIDTGDTLSKARYQY
jgi:hypothetical protein